MDNIENEKAIYPNYTTNEIYKALAKIAQNAGITIEYVEKQQMDEDSNVIGNSVANEYPNKVNMAIDHDYGTFEYATFVLAHEIAHTLTKELYSEAANFYYQDKEYIRHFFEADADKIGVALYTLASMTAYWETEETCRQL